MPDDKLAQRAGVHMSTVAAERKRRGVPAVQAHRPAVKWTEEMIALLGKATDREVAAELGLSVTTVYRKRRLRGIPPAHPQPYQPPRGHLWTQDEIALLGRMADAEAAERSPGLKVSGGNSGVYEVAMGRAAQRKTGGAPVWRRAREVTSPIGRSPKLSCPLPSPSFRTCRPEASCNRSRRS
jgi:hypothetical protein